MPDAIEINLCNSLRAFEQALQEDYTGDHARSLIACLDTAHHATQRMLARPLPAWQVRFLDQLVASLPPARRIVQQVWETIHHAALVS